jgi:hypothetical protein
MPNTETDSNKGSLMVSIFDGTRQPILSQVQGPCHPLRNYSQVGAEGSIRSSRRKSLPVRRFRGFLGFGLKSPTRSVSTSEVDCRVQCDTVKRPS